MENLCTDSVGFKSNSSTDWTSFENRLNSFINWPRQMKQKPEDMARAGFIYLNVGDTCKCFSCNVQVKSWESTDDPFGEHSRWSRDCNYLKMVGILKKPDNMFGGGILFAKATVHSDMKDNSTLDKWN